MAFNEMVVGFLEAGTDHISRDIAALDKVDTPVLIAASAYKLFVTQGDSATLAAQADIIGICNFFAVARTSSAMLLT
jgi:CO dehydrogenase nickel-insertion accessory protein CooC1